MPKKSSAQLRQFRTRTVAERGQGQVVHITQAMLVAGKAAYMHTQEHSKSYVDAAKIIYTAMRALEPTPVSK